MASTCLRCQQQLRLWAVWVKRLQGLPLFLKNATLVLSFFILLRRSLFNLQWSLVVLLFHIVMPGQSLKIISPSLLGSPGQQFGQLPGGPSESLLSDHTSNQPKKRSLVRQPYNRNTPHVHVSMHLRSCGSRYGSVCAHTCCKLNTAPLADLGPRWALRVWGLGLSRSPSPLMV